MPFWKNVKGFLCVAPFYFFNDLKPVQNLWVLTPVNQMLRVLGYIYQAEFCGLQKLAGPPKQQETQPLHHTIGVWCGKPRLD